MPITKIALFQCQLHPNRLIREKKSDLNVWSNLFLGELFHEGKKLHFQNQGKIFNLFTPIINNLFQAKKKCSQKD